MLAEISRPKNPRVPDVLDLVELSAFGASGDVVVITPKEAALKGDNSDFFATVLRSFNSVRNIIVDLKNVNYLRGNHFTPFVNLIKSDSCELVVCNISEQVRKDFDRIGLSGIIESADSLNDALATLSIDSADLNRDLTQTLIEATEEVLAEKYPYRYGSYESTSTPVDLDSPYVRHTSIADTLLISVVRKELPEDYGVQTKFIEELEKGLNQKPANIIVDLSNVSFLSSVGIGALLSLRNKCTKMGIDLLVCGAQNNQLRRLFETAFLDSFFPTYDQTTEEVLRSLAY